MSRTRAYTRFQHAMKKAKRAKYHNAYRYPATEQAIAVQVGKVTRSPALCGCRMCANARKVFGVPFCDIRRKARYTGGE